MTASRYWKTHRGMISPHKGNSPRAITPSRKEGPLDDGTLLVRLTSIALTPLLQFHPKGNPILDIIVIPIGVLDEGKKPIVGLTTRLGPMPDWTLDKDGWDAITCYPTMDYVRYASGGIEACSIENMVLGML